MIDKTFAIIAIICFGLAAMMYWLLWVFSEVGIPRKMEYVMAWIVVISVVIGIICITIGCMAFLLGV